MTSNLRTLLLIAACACGSGEAADDHSRDGSAPPVQFDTTAEVKRYVAARSENQKVFRELWRGSSDSAIRIDGAFTGEYEPILKRIVGPLKMQGLSDSARTHIGLMRGIYENDALADGLVYRANDGVQVFVTDTTIFAAWAAMNVRDGEPSVTAPSVSRPIAEIVRRDVLYSWVFDTGAASRAGSEITGVPGAVVTLLIEFSQDPPPTCSPDDIVVGVLSGRRILISRRAISDSVVSDSSRVRAIAQALAERMAGGARTR